MLPDQILLPSYSNYSCDLEKISYLSHACKKKKKVQDSGLGTELMSFCRLIGFIHIKWIEPAWPVYMIQADGIGDVGGAIEGSQQAQWLGDSCLLLNLGALSSGLRLTIPALNQTIHITPWKAKIDCLCNCIKGLDKPYVNVGLPCPN